MIKLKGKHDAALEIKDILKDQIKSKKAREKVEYQDRFVRASNVLCQSIGCWNSGNRGLSTL